MARPGQLGELHRRTVPCIGARAGACRPHQLLGPRGLQRGRQRVARHHHRLGPAYFVSEDEKLCPNSDNLLLSTWVMTGVMSSKQQSFETLKCVQRSQKNLDIFHGGRRLGYAEITHSGNYDLAEKVEIFSYQERSILTNR